MEKPLFEFITIDVVCIITKAAQYCFSGFQFIQIVTSKTPEGVYSIETIVQKLFIRF